MSASLSFEDDGRNFANLYVDDLLRRFKDRDFVLLNYSGRIFGSVVKSLGCLGDSNLLQILRLQSPIRDSTAKKILSERPEITILEVDGSISLMDRNSFYASRRDGILRSVDQREYEFLVSKGLA